MRKANKCFSVLITTAVFSLITTLSISINAQPPGTSNDNFANATVITDKSGYLQGSNAEASREPFEPPSCPRCRTVWYRWTAPENLSMTFELVMPTVKPDNYLSETVMDVWMGNEVSQLTMLAKNDDISA